MKNQGFILLFGLTIIQDAHPSLMPQLFSKLVRPISILARNSSSSQAMDHLQQVALIKEIKQEERKRFLKTAGWATAGIAISTPIEIAALMLLSCPLLEIHTPELYAMYGAWLASQTVPLGFALRSHQKSTEKICSLKNKLIL